MPYNWKGKADVGLSDCRYVTSMVREEDASWKIDNMTCVSWVVSLLRVYLAIEAFSC